MSGDLSGCDLSGCANCSCSEMTMPVEEQAIVENTWGLRLRARVLELGEDLSANIVHPIVRPPAFEELAERNVSDFQENLTSLYKQGVFYFLRFLNLSAKAGYFLWILLGNVTQGVKKTFQDEQFVFFKDTSYPYLLSDIKLNSPGVPDVEWYYNSKTHTFLTARLYNNSQAYHPHHIPYLTAEIRYNNLVLYDISEFINSVRWAGEESEAMPNLDHLISVWSLSSGIVLQRSAGMTLSVINTDGAEVQIPLRPQA